MTREEIDTLWQQALHDSVVAGETFTRYHFADLVIEECAKVCEELEEDDANPLFVSQQCANAIRARKSK